MKNKIGFYKYENSFIKSNYELPYYPINESILKNLKHLKYDMENNKFKKINGKLVVLI
jgi:hypothetical protein